MDKDGINTITLTSNVTKSVYELAVNIMQPEIRSRLLKRSDELVDEKEKFLCIKIIDELLILCEVLNIYEEVAKIYLLKTQRDLLLLKKEIVQFFDKKIKKEETKKNNDNLKIGEINDVQAKIIQYLNINGKTQSSKLYKVLLTFSPRTIRRNITSLLEAGIVKREQEGRNIHYMTYTK